MLGALLSRLVILVLGTLYPAYASYKAVRTKDVKEYVKWMMYWIVFAIFTSAETFADVLLAFWFPFYYELKVAVVIWMLSPATKGSSFLYRNFVHPALQKREPEIDEYLANVREKGYQAVVSIGTRSVTYATNVIVHTALKGGGGIMEQIKKSYSLGDIMPKAPISQRNIRKDETLDNYDGNMAESRVPLRSRRSGQFTPNVDMYFSEVDVNMRQYQPTGETLGGIRSSEDISSGYSSVDQLFNEGVLTRAASISLTRGRGGSTISTTSTRSTRQTRGRPPLTDDVDEFPEELGDISESQILSPNHDFLQESTNIDLNVENNQDNVTNVENVTSLLPVSDVVTPLDNTNEINPSTVSKLSILESSSFNNDEINVIVPNSPIISVRKVTLTDNEDSISLVSSSTSVNADSELETSINKIETIKVKRTKSKKRQAPSPPVIKKEMAIGDHKLNISDKTLEESLKSQVSLLEHINEHTNITTEEKIFAQIPTKSKESLV